MGVFGEAVITPGKIIWAIIALVLLFALIGQVTGFSYGFLGVMKGGFCAVTGGSAGEGALIGGGIAAGACGVGLALGFISFGTTALIGCGLGAAIATASGAAVASSC